MSEETAVLKKPGRPKKPEATADGPGADDSPVKIGFDPDQPYATLHGNETSAKYLQDGKYYAGDGREVDAP